MNLESIIAAIEDFLEKNMLGQGGFGPVYKGKLPRGEEIAVKRFSSLSGKGLQEFKNEVILLGYCIRGEEQILLYEYMPNRSLDTFIFEYGTRESKEVTLEGRVQFDLLQATQRDNLIYLVN
uniref:Protein kinase domain-containing protein n=1 Tax=Lactuca sativa TaxID=4236 RepID=A0A9R1VQ20_LACSA|nr:hypothetical protein LSAT_V11C400157340 [Lactuca sativa]